MKHTNQNCNEAYKIELIRQHAAFPSRLQSELYFHNAIQFQHRPISSTRPFSY